MDPRAGTPAQPSDLIDVDALVAAYDDIEPDVDNPLQQVVFGTSGHRGSAFDGAFNRNHILAITQAICEYRADQGTTGPLFIGADTHGLSGPATTRRWKCWRPTASPPCSTPATATPRRRRCATPS